MTVEVAATTGVDGTRNATIAEAGTRGVKTTGPRTVAENGAENGAVTEVATVVATVAAPALPVVTNCFVTERPVGATCKWLPASCQAQSTNFLCVGYKIRE